MEMFAYRFMMVAGSAGIIALIIGAIVGAIKVRGWPTGLQLVGAVAAFVAAVMQRLPLIHLEHGRLAPAWIWRTQEMLSGGGMLTFSIGFLWYWINRSGKSASEA